LNNNIGDVQRGSWEVVSMRRTRNPPHRSIMGIVPASFQEGNPEVWVHLGDEL